jgi:prepilin-type processing-associated H-X9-DG protein
MQAHNLKHGQFQIVWLDGHARPSLSQGVGGGGGVTGGCYCDSRMLLGVEARASV